LVSFYFFSLVALYSYGKPPDTSPSNFVIQIINISVGALAAAFATVVNFWLGSSAGSREKDDAAISLQKTQSEHTGAAIDALREKAGSTEAPKQAPPPKTIESSRTTDQQDSERLDACLPLILQMEGGYSNEAADRGGPTNYGITLATLKEWEGKDALTADDVKNMTQGTAKEIYRTNYWNRMQCGLLPKGLDLEVFDFGVNAGPSRAVKNLQKIVGVTEDGSMGPITLAAVRTLNPRDLVARFSQERLAFYQSLNQPVFLKGWSNRVNQIETAALKMAASPETIAV
jgi:hypothetical protein